MPAKTRRTRKRAKSTKAVAYKALKLARSVRQSIETKYLDDPFTFANVDWNGTLSTSINAPAQGITDSQRVGDSIKCTSLHLRLRVSRSGANTAGVRVLVIWDKYNTVTNTAQVLQNTGTQFSAISPMFHDGRGEFTLLMDKYIPVTADYKTYAYFQRRIRLNKNTQFEGGGLIISKGRLLVMAISDVSNLDPNIPDINFYTRVYYQDS